LATTARLMEMRQFGPVRREVSVIGEGTWNIEDGDRTPAIAALRRGFDLGINHVDTAEMYGDGAAELSFWRKRRTGRKLIGANELCVLVWRGVLSRTQSQPCQAEDGG